MSNTRKCLLVGAIAPALGNNISPGCLPFGTMALSSYLKQQGIQCKVVSTALPGAIDQILNELNNVDLVGISSMSGPYLSYAISVAEAIRKIKPDLPIVWGGPHASLMGDDLIKRQLADFVIKGVGEKSLLMLVKSLDDYLPLNSVPGLIYKENGTIRQNRTESNFNIDEFPQLDYSVAEKDYPKLLNEEFSYFTSRGCPFNCSYCVASEIYNRRWHDKSEGKIIAEISEAYDKYKFKSILFWDDNLFVDAHRLVNIFTKLRERNIHFSWSGFCRADTFSRLDYEVIEKLTESGLVWVSIGAESGSQRILNTLNKGIKVEQVRETAIRLKKQNIQCDFSFMAGLPGETKEDFYETLNLVRWIKGIYPQASTRIFRFIPYPKMPILNSIKDSLPDNSYDWCNVTYQKTQFYRIPKEVNRALYVLSPASMYSQKPQTLSLRNMAILFLYHLTQLRIKMRFFYFPLEGIFIEKVYDKLTLKVLKDFRRELSRKSEMAR